ncbi:MAG TPA: efflux RND transporter periplasmic adaptor subunit [Thermoanaerobaculia bacterium]|nr:efflux RND transporter periplasmic adaptor subunit [Thermoanaerobaculia bacterium]
MTKRVFILILTLTVLTLVRCGGEESKAETTATTATTATAEAPALPADVQAVATSTTGTLVATESAAADPNLLTATGEFVSPVRSELAGKVPGRVSKMFVDEGSRVTRGQPVLQLETDYISLNLRTAEAEIARAKAALDEAARDLERKKGLVAKGSLPQATGDRSQAVFDQANAGYQAARAQADLLRQQLADSTLRSPVTGIIAEKRIDLGARLGDGGVAFVVLQLSPLRLRFAVPERYLGKITVGDTITAKVEPYPNENFTGTVKTVGGVIDPKTRTMFAEAEFANRDGRLRPGLFARVETKLD